MQEVLERRFSGRHLNWPKPDLILIDGGKGQLSSARSALEQKGVTVPAIGLAKRLEEVIIKRENGFEAVELGRDSHVTKLLQRIRDESHRFAVSYHSTLKTGRQTSSLLEDIPSVGPVTRKKLLKSFGSVKGIIQASRHDLQQVVGPKKAALISRYLQDHFNQGKP
jgi:excinuclease ABC subunit C